MRTGSSFALGTSHGGQWCRVREDETGHEQEVRDFIAFTRIALKDSNVGALAFHLANQ